METVVKGGMRSGTLKEVLRGKLKSYLITLPEELRLEVAKNINIRMGKRVFISCHLIFSVLTKVLSSGLMLTSLLRSNIKLSSLLK